MFDEPVGNPVKINGTSDGTPESASGEHSAWIYKWVDLPVVDFNGYGYRYYAVEEGLAGYTAIEKTPINPDEQYITNEYEGISFSVQKEIIDDTSGSAHPPFTLVLYRNGDEYDRVTINGIADIAEGIARPDGSGELAATTTEFSDAVWAYQWYHLPKNDEEGNAYTYTVDEVNLPDGYVLVDIQPGAGTDYVITNERWDDVFRATKVSDSKVGTVPVTFRLMQQAYDTQGDIGDPVDMGMVVELDGTPDADDLYYEDAPWQAVWTELDLISSLDGLVVRYYAEEVADAGLEQFTVVSNPGGNVITNISNNTDIQAAKRWVGGSNLRPETATLTLSRYLANGDPDSRYKPLVAVLDGAQDSSGELPPSPDGHTWYYTWHDQPRFDAQGDEYVYTVTEEAVPKHYSRSYATEDGVQVVVNTFAPEPLTYSVIKVWKGGKTSPVTLRLYRDGALQGSF